MVDVIFSQFLVLLLIQSISIIGICYFVELYFYKEIKLTLKNVEYDINQQLGDIFSVTDKIIKDGDFVEIDDNQDKVVFKISKFIDKDQNINNNLK